MRALAEIVISMFAWISRITDLYIIILYVATGKNIYRYYDASIFVDAFCPHFLPSPARLVLIRLHFFLSLSLYLIVSLSIRT